MNPFRGLECHEPSIGWSEEISMWIVTAEKLPPEFSVADPDWDVAIEKFRQKLEKRNVSARKKDPIN